MRAKVVEDYLKNKKSIEDLNDSYLCVSFSGGKDSTVMLIEMVKRGIRIDEVVFSDTHFELPYLYEYIEKVKEYVWSINDKIKFTTLTTKGVFGKWAFGAFTRGRHKGKMRGFPTSVGMSYCTRELKVSPIDKYIRQITKDKSAYIAIGIAVDEPKRITDDPVRLYPLVEFDMTEDECIAYLKEIDLHNPLYEKYKRLGCWFCPKQNEKSLKQMISDHPDYWEIIKSWERHFVSNHSPYGLYKINGTKYYDDKFARSDTNLMEKRPLLLLTNRKPMLVNDSQFNLADNGQLSLAV